MFNAESDIDFKNESILAVLLVILFALAQQFKYSVSANLTTILFSLIGIASLTISVIDSGKLIYLRLLFLYF